MAVVAGAWLIVNVSLWAISAKGDLGVERQNWFSFTCSTDVDINNIIIDTNTNPDSTGLASCGSAGDNAFCYAAQSDNNASRCAEGMFWISGGTNCAESDTWCCAARWRCSAEGSGTCVQDPINGTIAHEEDCVNSDSCRSVLALGETCNATAGAVCSEEDYGACEGDTYSADFDDGIRCAEDQKCCYALKTEEEICWTATNNSLCKATTTFGLCPEDWYWNNSGYKCEFGLRCCTYTP